MLNKSQRETAQKALKKAEGDLAFTREQIIGTAEGIARDMGRLSQMLRAEPRSKLVNSIGELQSRGPALDAAIAKFSTQRDALDKLEVLITDLSE